MAKLTAPLLSFAASGQIAKTAVYFSWKGLNAVRKYVVPANPQSDDQLTQRGYMTLAVAMWHATPWTAADAIAWNRYAGTLAKIMSGFNAMVRAHIKEAILGNAWELLYHGRTSDVNASSFIAKIWKSSGGDAPTVHWGTSRTAMLKSAVMADQGGHVWQYDITGLAASTLYYYWVEVGASGDDYARTGIYQQRTTA